MFSRGLSTIAAGSVLAAVLLFAPATTRATTMVPLNEEDLTHMSDVIVVADVQKVETGARMLPSGKRLAKQISTVTTLTVVESWKGPFAAGDSVSLRELGGISGKDVVSVSGTAGFLTGERVLVFLSYRAKSNEYQLVGWNQGKYTLLQNGAGAWDAVKIQVPLEKWGSAFDAKVYENRELRHADLSSLATRVKPIADADVKANANWRDMPQYKSLAMPKGGAQ